MDRFDVWRKQAFATENFPWGSVREQRERLGIVARATREQAHSLRAHPGQHPVIIAVLIIGVLAALGDSASTLLMTNLTTFYESNVVAARLQDLMGRGGYAIFATLLSLALLPLVLVRGNNVIAWLLAGGGLTFILFKTYVAASNAHLLYTFLHAT